MILPPLNTRKTKRKEQKIKIKKYHKYNSQNNLKIVHPNWIVYENSTQILSINTNNDHPTAENDKHQCKRRNIRF
jgi:hypothetical protein